MDLLVQSPNENAVLAVENSAYLPPSEKRQHGKISCEINVVAVVWSEFLPQGAIVNSEYYQGVLTRLREAIRKKRPKKWKNG